MTEQESTAFAEAVLDRVAELAYDELRPHLNRWAAALQTGRPTTAERSTPTTADTPQVLPLDRARRRPRVA
ncbi:hypothetical protein Q2K19_10570 [Micromonospora soli]|uniref:hypothetical protein n=1 Tax=Micromonospora sp. NBRC 110009 TaxID=3061627 RepID=UPI0026731F31|nr:hypothetical protein [Micromonospora sp. NBRC 110009]WKU00881.1 hypothetical protein Q2K19_10570 [Micromonospora sp. NBRC 110009]